MIPISKSARIALAFFLATLLWRLISDRIIFALVDIRSVDQLIEVQGYRSLLFASIASAIVYFIFRAFTKRIRNSESQYEAIFQSNPNPMWVIDSVSKRFLDSNSAASSLYGYSREEFVHMTLLDLQSSEKYPEPSSSFKEIFEDDMQVHVTNEKKRIAVRLSSHEVRFKNKPALLIVASDITAQLEFESRIINLNTELELKVDERTLQLQEQVNSIETLNEELRAANEELSATNDALVEANEMISTQSSIISLQNKARISDLIESISDAFIVVDFDQIILRTNRAFERMSGKDRHELLGTSLMDVFSKATDPDVQRNLKIGLEERKHVVFNYYSPNPPAHLRIRLYPSEEGLIIYIVNINNEVEKNEAIQLAKRNLDALINNTTDPIWSFDMSYRLISCNNVFINSVMKATGRAPKPGDNILDEEFERSFLKGISAHYNEVLKGRSVSIDSSEKEYSKVFPSYSFHLNPIKDESGNIIGAGCFAYDTTEQRKREAERIAMINQLTRQNKNLEDFSYIVSHNLRAPVASIKGLVDIIKREEASNDLMLTMLDKSANRLDEVIIDLNKVVENRVDVSGNFELVNLADVVENVKQVLTAELEKCGAELTYDFDELPLIHTSKAHISSILFNLISNAIKYRDDEKRLSIILRSKRGRETNSLIIQDNGLGIDLDRHRDKLFQLYKRFHSHVDGKGIGLYLVRTQVEALQGDINVESQPGIGTRFQIQFPNNN